VEPHITKKIKEDSVYFTIYWSKIEKVNKYEIIRRVPSVAGIYELYYMDEKKKLNLFFFSKAWYGGLRAKIRQDIDPSLDENKKKIKILNKFTCYYRYSIVESNDDMDDILFFFSETYFPEKNLYEPSGIYVDIYVKEISPEKVITI